MQFVKTTILGGVLFLAPLVFVIFLLGKAFEVGMLVAEPLNALIPVDRIAGVALVNILAIALILGVCFLAGVIARSDAVARKMAKLDAMLLAMIPAYAFAKTMIVGMTKADDETKALKPVIAKLDDYSQIAFEVERGEDGMVIVYLPGSPNPWSGQAVAMAPWRVSPLAEASNDAIRHLRVLGRGSSHLFPAESNGAVDDAM